MATKKTASSTKSSAAKSASAKVPKKKSPATKKATHPKNVEVEVEEDLDLGDRLDEALNKVKKQDYGLDMAEAIDIGSRAATAYRLGEEVAEDPVQLFGVIAGIVWTGYKVWKEANSKK